MKKQSPHKVKKQSPHNMNKRPLRPMLKALLVPFLFLGSLNILNLANLEPYALDPTNVGVVLYKVHQTLLKRIAVEKPDDMILVLGTSRSISFSQEMLNKKTNRNGTIFNFSIPNSSPVYYEYILEEVLSTGTKPKAIIAEIDPLHYIEQSSYAALHWSHSWSFIWNHSSVVSPQPWNSETPYLSGQQIRTFVFARLFYPFRNPRFLRNISANLRNSSRNTDLVESLRSLTLEDNGAFPPTQAVPATEFQLREHASNFEGQYIKGYIQSPTQTAFFASLMKTAALNDISFYAYFAISTKQYRETLERVNLLAPTQNQIKRLATQLGNNFDFHFSDPYTNTRFSCREFIDSFHLTSRCIPLVFQEVY